MEDNNYKPTKYEKSMIFSWSRLVHKRRLKLMIFSLCFLMVFSITKSKASIVVNGTAVIVTDSAALAAPILHGINKLKSQLLSKGYKVIITKSLAGSKGNLFFVTGLASSANGEAAKQLVSLKKKLPEGLEALVIQKAVREKNPMLVLCGSDANGLMYALLDVARRIGLTDTKDDVLSMVGNAQEKAGLADRAISTYTVQRAYFESRLYDEKYWEGYLDQLAQSRINRFVFILGYAKDGFLAPLYPYFFDTDGFPDVKMEGLTAEQQKKNTKAFQRMIELAHERGIRFTVGIWSHIFHTGTFDDNHKLVSNKGSNTSAPYLVRGINSNNLSAYTDKALGKFLKIFPGIDGIQFRLHWESGLKSEEMPHYWHKIFEVIAKDRPELQIDLRAKGLPDEILDDALGMGLKISVPTKHWMEQMGLPFHPTGVQAEKEYRRHSYADLLSYPKEYQVSWKIWNGGTTRILLWGNPEYARRYAQSAHIYGGNSLEVNEPLATKMMRYTVKEDISHDQKPFELLKPEYQYYDYEFERYWYFFDVFGRMSYNAHAPEDLWNAEFNHRFGPIAGPLIRKSLHQASEILPRIVASTYNYTYFPTSMGWAETMPFGNLKVFSEGGGTDIMQFVSFAEEAQNIIDGVDDPRVSVLETSKWYAATADSILQSVKIAEKATEINKQKEFISTTTDLKILANLALYYSHRIKAAVKYNLFLKTKNINALDDAIDYEEKAVSSWKDIIASAGDVYSKELLMGRMGDHWEKMLKVLTEDKSLYEMRAALLQEPDDQEMHISHIPVRHLMPGKKLNISATIRSNDVKQVLCAIKIDNNEYHFIEMSPNGQWQYSVKADIPATASKVNYYLEAVDHKGSKSIFPENNSKDPISVLVTNDTIPPVATISRIKSAPVGKPLTVTAKVNDPSDVKWVRLRYRHVNQEESYQTVDMKFDKDKGIYSAEIPESFIIPKWDIMYFVEIMENAGNGRQYPDFEIEAPYVIVKLIR